MWPFTRTIILKHEGLEGLAEAFMADAAARDRQARALAGLIVKKREPEPAVKKVPEHEIAFQEWLVDQGWEENKTRHYAQLWRIFLREKPPTQEWTREIAVGALRDAGAPLPGV